MRVWLCELDALDPAGQLVTLRFSSGAYDKSPVYPYQVRIEQAGLYTNKAFTGAVLQGSRSGYGATVLNNADGKLNYLQDYAVDGRPFSLSMLEENGQVVLYFKASVQRLAFDGLTVQIILKDQQIALEQPHPQEVYAGNNTLPAGLEGTPDDIKGAKKPKVYGKVRSATPVLVNTSLLIYQVSSLTADVLSVYDRGAALTAGWDYASLVEMQSIAPAAGQFRSFQGYFRLGSSAVGTVTCDVNAPNAGAGSVFAQVAQEAGIVMNVDDTVGPNAVGEVGIYLYEESSTVSILDLIANSIGGYWFFDSAAAAIRLMPLAAPVVTTSAIKPFRVEAISRTASGAGSNGLPVYKVRVLADKIETVQTDLAGSVPAPIVARLAQEYREAIHETPSVKARHLLAEELVITSCLRLTSDAQIVADVLGGLFSGRRDAVSATVREGEQFDISRDIQLTSYKLGYEAGRPMKVLGVTVDLQTKTSTYDLWG